MSAHAHIQPVGDDPDEEDELDRLRSVADPLVGMTIADRYKIAAPIGAGGMGIVYRVEHTRISKLMAMKLLSGELSQNQNLLKRFKREATLASRLSHPNTVQVFDFGQADGLTYLVMELVTGEDLSRVLRRTGPLPFPRAARIIIQVCSSLAEAHRAGIVHRDLKPENIMIVQSPDGKTELAKVCDFGLAKLREAPELNDVTGHGSIVGTPYYMSPEQILGEDVDHRTDIYSLGAVLYRLLTGVNPFLGTTPMAVFQKHLNEAPIPPHQKLPAANIPTTASDIVMKAMAKETKDRFASIEQMQEALVHALSMERGSSYEILLDSGQLRSIEREIAAHAATAVTQMVGAGAGGRALATRDEVEDYERSLKRQRWVGIGALFLLTVAGVTLGGKALLHALEPTPFDGKEREPNNDASQAQLVPFGSAVVGKLGQRLNRDASDRDFFAIEVPEGVQRVRFSTTGVSNIPMCTWLYRSGMPDPIAKYCVGTHARDLLIDALHVDSGRYLVAILQDMDPYGADSPPLVTENVSDEYTLSITPVTQVQGVELEPNDDNNSATRVAPTSEVEGAISFMRDVDVFCPTLDTRGPHRWVVKDALERPRDPGSVLEVSVQGTPGAAVRIHRAGVEGKATDLDAHSPWSSKVFQAGDTPGAGCIRVSLTRDPWSTSANRPPRAGIERYHLKLEAMQ